MSNFPRETVEFQPITIKVGGVEVLTGAEVAVVVADVRPSVWVAPTTLGGKLGVMVSGRPVGIYDVWARITNAPPEVPVIYCGNFRVT